MIERSKEDEGKKAEECRVPEEPDGSGIRPWFLLWREGRTYWYRNTLARIISNGAPYKLYKFPKIWLTLLASPLIRLTIFPISAPAPALLPKSQDIRSVFQVVASGAGSHTFMFSLSNLLQSSFLDTDFPRGAGCFHIRARDHDATEIFAFESLVVDSSHQKGPRSCDCLASIPQVVHIRLSLPAIVIFNNQR